MNTAIQFQSKPDFIKLAAAVGLLGAVAFNLTPYWALPLMVKYYDLFYGAVLVHRH